MSGTPKLIDSPAARLVRQQIESNGPMTFREFVDLALYHPRHGYYNRSAPQRGRAGDYFTSLQVSGLFPEVIADALLSMHETLGAEQFTLIELGSGSGEFLEGVLSTLTRRNKLKGFRIWSVERSRPARDQLWKTLSRFPRCEVVSSLDEIEWMGGLEGCLFSNEFFDALSFHRVRYYRSGWREIYVDVKGGELIEIEGPLSASSLLDLIYPPPEELGEGQEIELRPQIPNIYQDVGNWIARGYVLSVDYGHSRPHLFSAHRSKGTWRCYYRHQMNEQPLIRVGEQDITADVDFTQLVEAGRKTGFDPLHFCSQAIFMSYLGKDRIEKGLASDDPDQKRAFAGVVQQLIHPDAMGERFWALVQSKGVPLPPVFQNIPNRLTRLTR